MNYNFFFGFEKTPFILYNNGVIKSNPSTPFHGIISLGLYNKLNKQKINSEIWHKNAHKLEFSELENDSSDAALSMLKECAKECKVLSFAQSALCAKLYVENYCKELTTGNEGYCEIWSIKEGHTSSVWKITIINSDLKELHFIINVARDYKAGFELKTTSIKMRDMVKHCPNINMAKVYDIQKVYLNYDNTPLEVIVTRNECIKNSYEIHSTINKANGKEQYLLVEKFLTDIDHPSQITSIYGRKFSEKEEIKIKNDIDFFLTNAKKIIPTDININEGDTVWDGKKATVIAIS